MVSGIIKPVLASAHYDRNANKSPTNNDIGKQPMAQSVINSMQNSLKSLKN
jgi:hypothetical protein